MTNGNDISLGSFLSTTANTRDIDLGASTISVLEGVWTVNGANLTSAFTNSTLLLDDTAGSATLTGGGQAYNIVRSQTATTSEVVDNNSFALLECQPSTTLLVNNGDVLTCDSLIISGTCNPHMQYHLQQPSGSLH